MALYDEAIVDAQKLREMAEDAAKQQILEAVTPRIRKLINARILAEQEDMEDDLNAEDEMDMSGDPEDLDDSEGIESEDDMDDMGDFDEFESMDDMDQISPVSPSVSSSQMSMKSKGVPVVINNTGDIKISADSDLSEGLFVTESFAGRRKQIDRRIENLQLEFFDLRNKLKNTKKLTLNEKSELDKKYRKLLGEAVSIRGDLIACEGGTQRLERKLFLTLKEMSAMSRRTKGNIFDFLFEAEDSRAGNKSRYSRMLREAEEEAAEDDAAADEEVPEAPAEEEPAEDIDLDKIKDLVSQLQDVLGTSEEAPAEEEPAESEGEEEPAEGEDEGLDLGEMDEMDDMEELDEGPYTHWHGDWTPDDDGGSSREPPETTEEREERMRKAAERLASDNTSGGTGSDYYPDYNVYSEGDMMDGDMEEMDEMYMEEGDMEEDDEKVEEVYEIDESALRRELGKMKRLRESRSLFNKRSSRSSLFESNAATERAGQFGGGEVLGDVFYEIDEDKLINVLADELGSVKSAKTHSKNESMATRKAMKEAAVYKQATKKLQSQLVEMNLFNAKLLYANKLMQNKNLTVKQQRAIVEALDNAKTLREAKLLYKSLSESLARRDQKSGNLSESVNRTVLGSSSRSIRSAQPAKSGVEVDRWAVLAGIPGGNKE